MIVARIWEPRSKLAKARGLDEETCFSSLSQILGGEKADVDELAQAMDWLLSKQESIEKQLAKRHLSEGSLVLDDLSSTYFEGTKCPLAKYGYKRDRKKGFFQKSVFGLICDSRGCPIAVEVFVDAPHKAYRREGKTSETTTITAQIEKVRTKFGLKQVIWVGS